MDEVSLILVFFRLYKWHYRVFNMIEAFFVIFGAGLLGLNFRNGYIVFLFCWMLFDFVSFNTQFFWYQGITGGLKSYLCSFWFLVLLASPIILQVVEHKQFWTPSPSLFHQIVVNILTGIYVARVVSFLIMVEAPRLCRVSDGCSDCDVEALPTLHYRDLVDLYNQTNMFIETDCFICLEKHKHNEPVSYLACRHVFHEDCVKRWLRSSSSCPFCQAHAIDVQESNI